jgi:uncharacterized membrane protein
MHAWHPLIVHFPLVLLLGGVVVEAMGWLKRRPTFRRAGLWLLTSGVLLALPAIATGLLAYNRVDHSEAAHALMTAHRNLMLAAVGLFAVAVTWRWRTGERVADGPWSAALYAALLTAATAALVGGGDRGADLVFDQAIGIPSKRMEAILQERHGDHHHGQANAEEGRPEEALPAEGGEVEMDGAGTPLPSQPDTNASPVHDDSGSPPHEH